MLEPNGTTEEAMIERIVHLGFEVRVEFTLPSDEHAWAQVTREEAEQLELREGQIVYVRPGKLARVHGRRASPRSSRAAPSKRGSSSASRRPGRR